METQMIMEKHNYCMETKGLEFSRDRQELTCQLYFFNNSVGCCVYTYIIMYILYYIVLYCIVLYYIILYCIILYYVSYHVHLVTSWHLVTSCDALRSFVTGFNSPCHDQASQALHLEIGVSEVPNAFLATLRQSEVAFFPKDDFPEWDPERDSSQGSVFRALWKTCIKTVKSARHAGTWSLLRAWHLCRGTCHERDKRCIRTIARRPENGAHRST